MDQDNENGQEAYSDTRETDSEDQPSSVQELFNVKDIEHSETPVTETLAAAPIVPESETKQSDSNESVHSSADDNNQSCQSPAPNDNVKAEYETPNTLHGGEESTNHDASPLSSSDENCQREIALADNEAVELFDKKGDCTFSDENLDSFSNENVSKCEDAPETNIGGEDSQQSVDASIPPFTEKTKDADSTVSEVHDNKDREKDSPPVTEDNVLGADTVIQEKIEEEDTNLAVATEDSAEFDISDVNENAGEEMADTNLSIAANKRIRNDSQDKDDGKGSIVTSVIDTSIFPKPPRESENNVVVANCFELDVMSQPISQSDFVPSDCIQSSCEIRDAIDSTAGCKSALPGPSDDREDISDEELDLECVNVQHTQSGAETNPTPLSISDHPGDCLNSESFVHKSDNVSLNSSDVGDIIDLKLEDAALKSIGSSCDKVSNEDLEAVSDDELPNVPHVSDLVMNQSNPSLLDDREEVSSSEDEELDKPQRLDATPISSEDEFPSQNEEASAVDSEKDFADSAQQSDSRAGRESLEAEPISDEEDTNIVSDEPAKHENSFDEGEAGEIKSPALGSPISEQGDLMLGEVEPVSADESPDTDGELPSGDEVEKGAGMDSHIKKFESIDSDEDIPGDSQRPRHSGEARKGEYLMSEEVNKSCGDKAYMETISDEENLDGDDSGKKYVEHLSHRAVGRNEESQNPVEKGHIPTGFNEHQVELDYEEGYGEEGGGDTKIESKEDESKVESKPTEAEDGEHIEQDQDLTSDKDEGELSDDDCEEGEIKEPGQRKMFVKPICRFFQRGHCTWGISCRFLHPGVNDKGNYQMIEVPGFKPVGIHARLGIPGQYPDQQPPPQEEAELPPPPVPDVPRVETAWERGLRIAKEQRKKASERKEQEPDFEEKRLNLSVEEDRELNKENERTPRIVPKDPYYDQQAYEVDEYYKIPRDPWHTGHYENFEVRYHHQENSYSPPYCEKPPIVPPPMRYTRPLSPPIDKFGRHREDRPVPPERHHEPIRVSDFPPPVNKHPDEWIDPWRRSKSPKQRKPRSHSRGRKTRRSLSDSSDSSRSSRSSSGSSRSSRSGSSTSSSRSRSPEPAPPGVDRMERHDRYGGDQPRSMVSVRGPEGRGAGSGGYNRYNNNDNFRYGRGNQGYSSNNNRGGGGFRNSYNPHNPRQDMYQGGRGGGAPGGYNNYRGYVGRGGSGVGGGYNNRDPRGRYGSGRNMSPSRGGRGPTPDRPLPYTRPRPKSRSSSRSSSSRSRSRSRSKSSDSSRSRSSSNSSRSSSSSSSSGVSADSDHLYRDLGSPSKTGRHPASQKKRPGVDSRKDNRNAKSNHHISSTSQSASRHPPPPSGMDGSRALHPRSPPHARSSGGGDPKYSQIPLPPPSSSSGRGDTKYASRNAPQPPVKAKDPLKVVGQKSNIKLTLLPKQQQQSNLGDRPNPLASPPHKRRMSDRDLSPPTPPLNKRPNLSMQASSLRMAADKAAKLQIRSDKAKSPPPGSLPPPQSLTSTSSSSSAAQRSKNTLPPITSPQKQPTGKSRPTGESVNAKPTSKAPSGGSAPTSSNPSGAKSKKSMSSRREELLKQLKAVEDAIARKKFKMS